MSCLRIHISFKSSTRQSCLRGAIPSSLSHSTAQSLSYDPVTYGPFMLSLRSIVTSCSITVISPCWRWNGGCLERHLSIRALSKGQSSLTHLDWEWVKNPARLTYSMTRSSVKNHCWRDCEWSNISSTLRSCSFAHKLQLLNLKEHTILIFKFINTYPARVNLRRSMSILRYRTSEVTAKDT